MSTNGNGHSAALSDHLPPQNLEAERSVLGGLLLDNVALPAVRELLAVQDFYRDAHQVIYGAICDLADEGKPIDPIILADELTRRDQYKQIGGDETLFEIANSVPHAANTVYHAGIVLQKSAARQAVQSSTEIIRDGYSNLFTADQLLESARTKFARIRSTSPAPWPELMLEHEPSALPFPVDVFPEALRRFCRGAAAVTLSALDVPGVAMLATAGAAIGQSVNLYLKRTYHETTLLFIVIVADPGRSKTPPVKLVVSPLTAIDRQLRDRSKLEREVWEEAKKMVGKSATVGPPPLPQRAIVKDITRETLAAILAANPRGVLVDPDEATGWVGSFNQYRAKGTDRQFWLDLWSSRPTSVDREEGNRSYYLPSPLAVVLGGIPPDMMGVLQEDRGRNDGFIDRLLFSFPAEFPEQRWIKDELDHGDQTTWHAIVEKLHRQTMFYDEQKKLLRPYLVNLSPRAEDVWAEWYDAHCKDMAAEDAAPWVPGVYSKLRGYCARLALILSRLRLALDPEAEREIIQAPVEPADVLGAIRLTDYFKAHAARVYHRQTGGTRSQDGLAILQWIQRKGLTEFREALVRADLRRKFPDLASLAPALRALEEANAIRLKPETAPPKRGPRPTRMFEVHPGLRPPPKDLREAPEIT
jgi:Protein of unknown function (DUF3987)/DnaB-like helicase N terminal domain